MNFTVLDVEQRSEAWHQARLGRLTSTCADALLATGRGGDESAQRKNLLMKLALEQITGKCNDRALKTDAMDYGADFEPEAFAAYEAETGELLTRSGFLQHNSLMAGTSLDGHTDSFSLFAELKVPYPAQHLDYLTSGNVPLKYFRQCLHHFWITGALACDWVSYCREFPERAQTKIVRIELDDFAPIYTKTAAERKRVSDHIEDYDKKARALLIEVDATVNTIKTLGNVRAQLEASIGV